MFQHKMRQKLSTQLDARSVGSSNGKYSITQNLVNNSRKIDETGKKVDSSKGTKKADDRLQTRSDFNLNNYDDNKFLKHKSMGFEIQSISAWRRIGQRSLYSIECIAPKTDNAVRQFWVTSRSFSTEREKAILNKYRADVIINYKRHQRPRDTSSKTGTMNIGTTPVNMDGLPLHSDAKATRYINEGYVIDRIITHRECGHQMVFFTIIKNPTGSKGVKLWLTSNFFTSTNSHPLDQYRNKHEIELGYEHSLCNDDDSAAKDYSHWGYEIQRISNARFDGCTYQYLTCLEQISNQDQVNLWLSDKVFSTDDEKFILLNYRRMNRSYLDRLRRDSIASTFSNDDDNIAVELIKSGFTIERISHSIGTGASIRYQTLLTRTERNGSIESRNLKLSARVFTNQRDLALLSGFQKPISSRPTGDKNMSPPPSQPNQTAFNHSLPDEPCQDLEASHLKEQGYVIDKIVTIRGAGFQTQYQTLLKLPNEPDTSIHLWLTTKSFVSDTERLLLMKFRAVRRNIVIKARIANSNDQYNKNECSKHKSVIESQMDNRMSRSTERTMKDAASQVDINDVRDKEDRHHNRKQVREFGTQTSLTYFIWDTV